MRKIACGGSLKLRIRCATKDDLDSLLNLENICFKEEIFHKRQLRYLLQKARSLVLVTEIDGNIIGSMIILLRKKILNARIYSFNVHPEHRRKGIGGLLMDKALDILGKKGYKNITLEVGVNNQIAQNLYHSKGFIVDKKLPNYYTNGGDALHLVKKSG